MRESRSTTVIRMTTIVLVIEVILANGFRGPTSEPSKELLIRGADVLGHLIRVALLDPDQPNLCSTLVFTDGKTSSSAIKKFLDGNSHFRGATVMELEVPVDTRNISDLQSFSDVIKEARKVRLSAWCLMVLVVSEDTHFLEWLAEAIQNRRFLIWTNRMMVLSRIPHTELLRLLRGPWTFSMMTTVFVNQPPDLGPSNKDKWSVYTQLPYSPEGDRTVRLASWTPKHGIIKLSPLPIFSPKFNSFHGATINVTALPFSPHWDEEIENNVVKERSGTDYFMLDAIARSLDFEFRIVPTQNWGQVVDRVAERVSFLSPISHIVLPRRKEKYDFSFTYGFSSLTFAMAKPALKPQWQSLYYPLADQVWASILATVFFMPLPLYIFSRVCSNPLDASISQTLLVAGTLFGQSLHKNIPSRTSYRMLLGIWLIFAYIVGIAYRGNLTAFLTRPKHPSRPENIHQLVVAEARIGMPPYGANFRQFYLDSESPDFRKIGERFVIVQSVKEGLQRCLQENFAFMESRRYLQMQIARDFTQPDGSIGHYIAREVAFPGLSAWPFPHDAPYKHVFDRKIMRVVEVGLYEKWNNEMLEKARLQGRRLASRNREEVAQDTTLSGGGQKSAGVALTLTHLQGPLFLLLLGWSLVFIVFCIELGISRIQQKREMKEMEFLQS